MECKYHPDREAEQFCGSCGIPLCPDCSQGVALDQYLCYQCAMLYAISSGRYPRGPGETMKREAGQQANPRIAPYQCFILLSLVMILVMLTAGL